MLSHNITIINQEYIMFSIIRVLFIIIHPMLITYIPYHHIRLPFEHGMFSTLAIKANPYKYIHINIHI